ncbi:efflux RND transporter permease subunit [Oscillatoria sp. FACHB-1406]|uniref:efflux RND transporter permease subunit n=1 Tax=Oscillatoria sp. FACHB-1406 TaxID=2692846 RepID=UPI001686AD52|nr:efflux RND transporter permease subunit [Oscillatoria sp. FACHB-1406]MBD2579353.1 efflux RND transporter permease subunit [Oscillatoria sp. FACHB-1406]
MFDPTPEPQNASGLSALSIRRHIGVLMLTLAVIVVGVFFIFRLQVDLLPAITYPRIGLRLDAPGVSPDVAVEEITKPLEEALSATEGVVQVYSQTREGRVSLDLFFQPGGDIDQALNDAAASLNRARSSLPDVVEEPRLFKVDPSQLPIYEFALESSSLTPTQLRIFAEEELARELGVIPGVASASVSGGGEEEVRVEIDLARLQGLGAGVQNVLDALRDRNQDISGGRLQGEAGEPLTRTVGRFQSVEELRNLSLVVPGSNLQRRIYLRDVAEIIDGTAEQRVFVSLNGKPAIKVSLQKQPDANTISVIEGVKERLEFLRQSGVFPADLQLVVTLDESRFIQNSISNVVSSGLSGTLLAALAVFIFLGSLRQTFIIVIAIPLATLAAIILMKLFGLSLNVFSLGGLALGVGIVVDNSIVMLENIALGAEASRDRNAQFLETAQEKGKEVESALIASTATNLVSVLPFLLIGGFVSLLFNELILTISFSVAASLAVALTVVPMLASRLLVVRRSSGVANWWILRQFQSRFEAATQAYGRLLGFVLGWRLPILLLLILLLGSGSYWMAGQLPQELIPKINTGQANLFVQFPPGTTLESNRKIMAAVDEILLEQPETEYAFTTSGGSLFGNTTSENLLRSSSTIAVKPGTDIEAFVERTSKEFDRLNLVDTRVRLSAGQVRGIILTNSPTRGDLDLILQGTNLETLQATGRSVLKLLDEKVQSARFRPEADPQQNEVQIFPDWQRLESLGLTVADLGRTIQTAIQGSVPTQLQRGNRLIDVRVRLSSDSRQRISQLEQLPLLSLNDRTITLREVATLDKNKAPGEIQRINQREVFIITGNLAEGASLSQAMAEVDTAFKDLKLPQGITLLPSATSSANKELQNALKLLGGLAIFLVFVTMAVQYNSIIDPFAIILTVPLALAGGIFGLFVTETAVGVTVLVGAVLLVGIVVNNAIIMVEFANQLHAEFKLNRVAAIQKAAAQRLRPILMTTITTVLGLFPLALGIGEGSEFLQPLGVVVFSGLALATLLTLFVVPCFYVLLHDGLFSQKRAL